MSIVRPFKGIKPKKELVDQVASLPYDVMNREEAKKLAEGNEYSFLHVVRSEIDLADSVSPYDESVYKTARKNLDQMIEDKILVQDEKPMFYIYRQIMNGRVQTGIVGATSIDDYLNNVIKKHEYTRPKKEVDRINNFDYCDANTAPIFLTYRKNDKINSIINDWIKFHMPIYDFKSEDDITHIVWELSDESLVEKINKIFGNEVESLYIADGHHRSASSVKVGLKRREENSDFTGDEEYNYFMSVMFPDEDLFIMDYNRVVHTLNGLSFEDFMDKVKEKFNVEKVVSEKPFKPTKKHTFGMYIENYWYELEAKEGIFDDQDPVDRLDVAILQNNILDPLLGIEDPRTSDNIDFVGGIRGLKELEERVDHGKKVAFSMYPTTMDDLLSIADAGKVMPPKSTWFEPKLRSGLFVHRLTD
jgi:uncharacterized protein (DUF1015 family)